MSELSRKELQLEALRSALDGGTLRPAQRMLTGLHPAEIALLLESVPPRQRELVWNMVDPELEGDVLLELSEGVRQELIEEMETEELVAAAEGMELDDLADLVRELPETVTMQVLRSMDQRDRERLRNVLSWPEDSAGGLMNTDTVSVRPDVTLEVVLRYLRMRGELPSRTDSLFVVDRDDRYLGTILLTRIITGDPENTVGDSLDTDAPRIEPDMPAHDVARLFQERDLVSAAVVDSSGSLLGRITIDDVVDVIREEAAHEVMSMAGLKDEEDLFAGIVQALQHLACGIQVEPACFGQCGAAGAAFEQLRAELGFQMADRLGQGRGGLTQLLGRAAKAAVLGGGDKHAQGAELVHRVFPVRQKRFAWRGGSALPCQALVSRRNQ